MFQYSHIVYYQGFFRLKKSSIFYKDDGYETKLLFIMLSKTTAFAKIYVDETNLMSFLIENNELLRKSNKIWNKVGNSIKKVSESIPIYNETYLKTNMKSYNY